MDQENQTQQATPTSSAPAAKGGGGGKAVVFIIIILVIIVLGGGYVAYAKLVKKASSLGAVFSPATLKLDPNCKYNDPDLCKFMNNWKSVDDMIVTSDSTGSDGKGSTLTLKIKGSDKDQMIVTEAGKETYNYITIGNTSYTKDYTDNKWFKYTYSADKDLVKSEESKIDFDAKEENVADKTTYQKIGTEACGKYTCFKYQVIDPAVTDSTEYIYFDNKEYLLRKTRSEAKDGSISEAAFDYSNFSISEPSPVKEGNPYEVPAGTLPSLNSQAFSIDEAALEAAANALNSNSASTTDASSTDTSSDTTTTDTTQLESVDFPTEE